MISDAQFKSELQILISNAIREDVGDGDHSSMACIPIQLRYSKIISKDDGIIAGVEFAIMIFHYIDPNLTIDTFIADGMPVKYGDVVFHVSGSAKSILKRKEWF
jgi:nicotinate-nucleotide pyrophosphorylase (carboxylating)